MWRDFRRRVDGIGGLDEDVVVASARWTFGAFTASCGAVPA
jgi:hypothetical protein